ncbi:unnamed protein product [Owenia fusiformis]|uniref:Uncharacterized protein n=1 Tax=Owenia fusiformis TaxID=6347 RepID=A0A8J1U889_OWEFU|nr:unnamed protein product [Owenia fusiformis]
MQSDTVTVENEQMTNVTHKQHSHQTLLEALDVTQTQEDRHHLTSQTPNPQTYVTPSQRQQRTDDPADDTTFQTGKDTNASEGDTLTVTMEQPSDTTTFESMTDKINSNSPRRFLEHDAFKCIAVSNDSVYLIGICQNDFKGTAMERNCLGGDGTTIQPNIITHNTPCFDPMTKRHYKNIYCAKCNHVENPLLWTIQTHCFENEPVGNMQAIDTQSLLHMLISDDCLIEYILPDARYPARKCYDMVSVCPFTEADSPVSKLCVTHGLSPVIEQRTFTTYKNKYCWTCHNTNRSTNRSSTDFLLCKTSHFVVKLHKGRWDAFSFQMFVEVDLGYSLKQAPVIQINATPIQNLGGVDEIRMKCQMNAGCRIDECPTGFERIGIDGCVYAGIAVATNMTITFITTYPMHNVSEMIHLLKGIIIEVAQPVGVIKLDTPKFFDSRLMKMELGFNTGIRDQQLKLGMINNILNNRLFQLKEVINRQEGFMNGVIISDITIHALNILPRPMKVNSLSEDTTTGPKVNENITSMTREMTSMTREMTSTTQDFGLRGNAPSFFVQSIFFHFLKVTAALLLY